MDLELLDRELAARAEPRFRARQIWAWAAAGANGFDEMTNLPAALRAELARRVPFSSLQLRAETRARDGTVKALFATLDGHPLEAVAMSYREGRRSICISSQSGCPLTCTFCATGSMRFARNLSAWEILDQALHFRRTAPITNCVFMGMGEPLLNLDAVLAACERLPDVGISQRRIAISTVGWIPGIERLAEVDMPVRLALSLHAADEALRSELMPVNERFPLRDVLEACRAFYARKRRRVFVEYVMLAGVNDRYEQALSLARLLAPGRGPTWGPAGRLVPERGAARARAPTRTRTRADADGGTIFTVNLIPYNPISVNAEDGGPAYRASSRDSITAFRAVLERHGIPTTVRLERGREIAAACGQLAVRSG